MRILRAGFFSFVLAATLSHQTTSAANSCESLARLMPAQTTVTLAQIVAAGGFKPSGTGGGAAFANLPAFCRVAAAIKPTTDSDIKVEVWMPSANWNGKLQAVGNGGWAGTIGYAAMAEALRGGYATVSTDTGHSGDNAAWAMGHPEKLIDYAYRSEHEMTVKAKELITAFYGTAPKFSYFNGCSTGGRQALVEARRYPEDFDGIIAGAAANPKTHLDGWRIWMGQRTLVDPATVIPPAKYPIIHQAVLAACDALDGVKDGLLQDPTRCHFDPQTIACKQGDAPGCLTAKQVISAKTIMNPVVSHSGEQIFPGYQPGTELAWDHLLAGPNPYAPALDQYKFLVFEDPNWDWRTFDVDRDVARADKVNNGTLSYVDANLTAFLGRGGKLLMYHGWSDQSIAPLTSVNYYNSLTRTLGGPEKTMRAARLFMVPGMGHCRGGEGPDTFNKVAALEAWVEKGEAPDQIVASRSAGGKVERTRPLCPYPQVATYTGKGSIDEAVNFACKVL